jgi:hypothetical protein
MQNKSKEAIKKLQQKSNPTGSTAESLMKETTNERNAGKRVHYPDYWKKKRMNPDFVKQLQQTVNSEPIATDEHGEYRTGKFLHSCAVIVVSFVNNLWSLEIHSQYQVNLPMIQEVRYKYLPDSLMMALLFLPRDQRTSDKVAVLYQIPGELRDNADDVDDVPFEETPENEDNRE